MQREKRRRARALPRMDPDDLYRVGSLLSAYLPVGSAASLAATSRVMRQAVQPPVDLPSRSDGEAATTEAAAAATEAAATGRVH
eukprot:scaffold107970_cov17-Tisochrysis_lutea.AAC.1